jgi:hypothetical protein
MSRRGEKPCHTCNTAFDGDFDEHWCDDDCKIEGQCIDDETGKQSCDCCSAKLDPSRLKYYEMELSHRLRTQEGFQNESRGRWLCLVCSHTHISSSVQYPRQWMGDNNKSRDIAQAIGFVGATVLEKLEQLGADDTKAMCDAESMVNVLLNFHSWFEAGEVHMDQIRNTYEMLAQAIPPRIQNRAISLLTKRDAEQGTDQ